jgi:hypothetical protein
MGIIVTISVFISLIVIFLIMAVLMPENISKENPKIEEEEE